MAALTSVLQGATTLTRDEGIVRLSSCFQWREFEGDDQRQCIHQEFVYENVKYSVQRGLPWAAVAQIANLSKELLPELRGLDRAEATSLVQARLSRCEPRLSPAHYAALHEFMVMTYSRHQHLYQAFLKQEANLKRVHSHLEIHAPPHPLRLSEGTDVAVWEKQQALKELTAAETVKHAEIHQLKEQAEVQLMEKLQVSLGDLSLEDRLDKQAVESMVRSILQPHGGMVKEILMKEIRAVQELLEIRLSQMSLIGAGHSSDASGLSQKSSTKIKKK